MHYTTTRAGSVFGLEPLQLNFSAILNYQYHTHTSQPIVSYRQTMRWDGPHPSSVNFIPAYICTIKFHNKYLFNEKLPATVACGFQAFLPELPTSQVFAKGIPVCRY